MNVSENIAAEEEYLLNWAENFSTNYSIFTAEEYLELILAASPQALERFNEKKQIEFKFLLIALAKGECASAKIEDWLILNQKN